MVGNDGGVQTRFGSSGPNQYTAVINKGYNVTQFYSMGFGGNGSVIGGAQDNGTQLKDNSQPWSKEFVLSEMAYSPLIIPKPSNSPFECKSVQEFPASVLIHVLIPP